MKKKKLELGSLGIIIVLIIIFLLLNVFYRENLEIIIINNIYMEKIVDISEKTIINNIQFYSSTPTIINDGNKYILVVRYVNYLIKYILNFRYINYLIGNRTRKYAYTINKYIEMDENFNILSQSFFDYNLDDTNCFYNGIEDLKLFNNSGNSSDIYYIGTVCDNSKLNNNMFITTDKLDITKKKKLDINLIYTKYNNKIEKNWVYLNYNNSNCLIYKWYPIQICNITNNMLNVIEEKKNVPNFFKQLRGSTNGYTFQDEIFFIAHLKHNSDYTDILLIFDTNMNLKKYSKFFRFGGTKVEFCLGLIVNQKQIIISYSTNDNTSKIGIYNKKSFLNDLIEY